MTSLVAPICYACQHLDHRPGRMRCAAYPKGVPRDIMFSRVDHRQPVKGDGGIVFEQAPHKPIPPQFEIWDERTRSE